MHFLYLIVLTLPVAGFFIREPEIENYMYDYAQGARLNSIRALNSWQVVFVRHCFCSSWIYWITPVHYAFGTLMIGEVYRNVEYADTGRYDASLVEPIECSSCDDIDTCYMLISLLL